MFTKIPKKTTAQHIRNVGWVEAVVVAMSIACLTSHSCSLLLWRGYKIGDSNNQLVFDNFDEAVSLNPDAHPLFHSDRGFQYTSRIFYTKLQAAKMRQSMSRVGRCIDNGPMESFWGMLKPEMYYLRRFTDRDKLILAIENYIDFYNNGRYQKRLRCMMPMEFHYAYAA